MNDINRLLPAYFHLMNANGAAHLYREALRSGILPALASGEKSAAVVAQECGTIERPTKLMLEALAALNLAQRNDNSYRLTDLAFLLLSGTYRNLGDEYWAHLPTLLKTDQPLLSMDDVSKSEAHYQAQAAILGWMLTPAAEYAADHLINDLPPSAKILDLGAGSAIWSLTLASKRPDITVTAVDWPAVLEVAAEKAQELGLASRLTTLPGNFHEIDLPLAQFDLAIIANVCHLLTPAGNQALFRRVRPSLTTSGRLILIDVFPGQAPGDINRTLYALGLALRTNHGHVYSAHELEPLLTAAGYANPRLVPLQVPPYALAMLISSNEPSSRAA
jgi:hypothetical protein